MAQCSVLAQRLRIPQLVASRMIVTLQLINQTLANSLAYLVLLHFCARLRLPSLCAAPTHIAHAQLHLLLLLFLFRIGIDD